MRAISFANELLEFARRFGDRDLYFFGRIKGKDDIIFKEEVTDIRIVVNDAREPFTLYGRSGSEFTTEKLIHLNWLGRLLKRFIIQK